MFFKFLCKNQRYVWEFILYILLINIMIFSLFRMREAGLELGSFYVVFTYISMGISALVVIAVLFSRAGRMLSSYRKFKEDN